LHPVPPLRQVNAMVSRVGKGVPVKTEAGAVKAEGGASSGPVSKGSLKAVKTEKSASK
jgi:hypothetical protein